MRRSHGPVRSSEPGNKRPVRLLRSRSDPVLRRPAHRQSVRHTFRPGILRRAARRQGSCKTTEAPPPSRLRSGTAPNDRTTGTTHERWGGGGGGGGRGGRGGGGGGRPPAPPPPPPPGGGGGAGAGGPARAGAHPPPPARPPRGPPPQKPNPPPPPRGGGVWAPPHRSHRFPWAIPSAQKASPPTSRATERATPEPPLPDTASPCRQRRKSSSRYLGSGHIWSSTISSSLSMRRRISSKHDATVSW